MDYFDLAVGLAREQVSSVRVVLVHGEATFARAEVDEFEPGQLTITAIADGRTMQTYAPGTWLSATRYQHGHPVHFYTSALLEARVRLASEQFSSRES